MVKALYLVFLLLFSTGSEPDGWELFGSVKFSRKEIAKELYLVPFFDSKIRGWEGKEITLEGFYIPMDLVDKQTIIISKVANASCFFCGASGPETVAEVQLLNKRPKMKVDQVIRVKGTLKLNDNDVDHMNFILESAELTILK